MRQNCNNKTNYEKPRLNNNLKKRLGPKINPKAFVEYVDTRSTNTKWLKVSCSLSSESENCIEDIVKKIECLLYRNNGKNFKLRTWNECHHENTLQFYMKIQTNDIDYLMKNVHRIKPYHLKCYQNDHIHIAHEIPSKWIELIKRALKNRFKINQETNETELNLSSFFTEKVLTENSLLLYLSSPRILECVVHILKTELQELSFLNLSNNHLSNISKLQSLVSCVKISKLDLSNNRITNIADLNPLKLSTIIDLNITGNHLPKMSANDFKSKIQSMIPSLRTLNGTKLKEPVLIAGEILKETPQESSFVNKDSDIYRFVINYLSKFDTKDRNKLCDFYSQDSVITLSKESLNNITKSGKEQIMEIFSNIPQTKHIEETINVNVIDSVERFAKLNVTGVFIEVGTSGKSCECQVRQFSRIMIVASEGIISQEFIELMPNDPLLFQKHKSHIDLCCEIIEFRKLHCDLDILSFTEIQSVKELREKSLMNIPTCVRFITTFNSFDRALAEFRKLQSEGAVPAEVFEH